MKSLNVLGWTVPKYANSQILIVLELIVVNWQGVLSYWPLTWFPNVQMKKMYSRQWRHSQFSFAITSGGICFYFLPLFESQVLNDHSVRIIYIFTSWPFWKNNITRAKAKLLIIAVSSVFTKRWSATLCLYCLSLKIKIYCNFTSLLQLVSPRRTGTMTPKVINMAT